MPLRRELTSSEKQSVLGRDKSIRERKRGEEKEKTKSKEREREREGKRKEEGVRNKKIKSNILK